MIDALDAELEQMALDAEAAMRPSPVERGGWLVALGQVLRYHAALIVAVLGFGAIVVHAGHILARGWAEDKALSREAVAWCHRADVKVADCRDLVRFVVVHGGSLASVEKCYDTRRAAILTAWEKDKDVAAYYQERAWVPPGVGDLMSDCITWTKLEE